MAFSIFIYNIIIFIHNDGIKVTSMDVADQNLDWCVWKIYWRALTYIGVPWTFLSESVTRFLLLLINLEVVAQTCYVKLLLKIDSGTDVFMLIFLKFLRTPFCIERLWWLPLSIFYEDNIKECSMTKVEQFFKCSFWEVYS